MPTETTLPDGYVNVADGLYRIVSGVPTAIDEAGATDGDVLTFDTGAPAGASFQTPAGGSPSGSAGGDLTGTYPNPTLGTAGTSGTYTKVTTDTKGRVTSGTTLAAADIPSLDAAKITTGVLAVARLASGTPDGTKFVRDDGTLATPTVASAAPSGSAGGDLTGSYPNPTLGAVGTAGTYKSVTTDSKGRVTAGTNPTTLSGYGITDAIASGATAGGDLAGTYPNPTIKSSVALGGSPTTTTQSGSDSSTKIATTAQVQAAIAAAVALGGGGAMVRISEQVVGVAVATITFSSIVASYRDLRLVIRGRGTASATTVDVRLRFNGDTGSNYAYVGGFNVGGTSTAFDVPSDTFGLLGWLTAGTSPASAPGYCEAFVSDYRGTTFQKTLRSQSDKAQAYSANNLAQITAHSFWKNTAAVTSIDVTLSSGNFATDCVATLYGIY